MTPSRYPLNGFARFEGLITPAAVQEARAWIDANRTRADLPSTQDLRDRGNPLPIKLRHLWEGDREFWRHFLRDSGVLALPRALLGEEFLMIRSAAFIKYPRSSAIVGWHCDADLWGHPCGSAVTAWIPLTPARLDGGCLRFVPGSHLRPHGRLAWDWRHPYHKTMDVSRMPEAVPVPAEPGDCIAMDKRCVHASGANETGQERIGLVLAFARCARQDLNESAVAIRAGDVGEEVVPA